MHHILQHKLQTLLIPLVMLLALVASTSCSPTPNNLVQVTSTPSLQNATKEPVLLIHGIPDIGADSVQCNDYNPWGDVKQVLEGTNKAYPIDGQTANWSYTNLVTIGYYTNDKDCDVQLAPNNPNRPQAQSNNPLLDVSGVLLDIERNCGVAKNTTVNKENTSIETLSCMVAWYIWDNFSHKGQNVRVVAHSLGGLIIRYALYASRGACMRETLDGLNVCLKFPPSLRISNVVTIDTPHGGIAANLICNDCIEGNEMVSHVAGNDFMGTLYNEAQSPQGQGGTMWMLMGSACAIFGCSWKDSISAYTNSRYMKGAWLKVLYTCVPICYSHGSFLTDSSYNWDTNVKFCTYCQAGVDGPKDTLNMPHSLYMIKYGLLGIDPRHDSYRGTFSINPTPTPTSVPTTFLPTLITCPSEIGTAREAVMTQLSLGTHSTIVYIKNKVQGNMATGMLLRYDIATGNTSDIVDLANTPISDAQISKDGQWIIFVSQVSGESAIQMVRLDGEELQTLYCSSTSSISNIQWSPDQHSIVFSENQAGIYLLNITNGDLQVELAENQGPPATPLTWLDNTRVIIIFEPGSVDAPQQNAYILDTRNGTQQNNNNLQVALNISDIGRQVASSTDGTKLFISQCACGLAGNYRGPSSVSIQPMIGGSESSVYTNPTEAVTTVQAISSTALLFLIETYSPEGGVDTSQNGLWKINIDGSSLTRLTTDTTDNNRLNAFSEYSWANASRDGSMYALQKGSMLLYGSLSGGAPTVFADLGGTPPTDPGTGTLLLAIVGWTTM